MNDAEIVVPSPELTSVDLLVLDETNPNKMTIEQEQALSENIKKFGFIIPVITNKDYVVADGEHRLLIAKKLGIPTVPVIRLDINDVDRRVLRQVLNKLRGSHDIELDLLDYDKILSTYSASDFSKFLGQTEEEIKAMVGLAEIKPKEKDIGILLTEHTCPKCNYQW